MNDTGSISTPTIIKITSFILITTDHQIISGQEQEGELVIKWDTGDQLTVNSIIVGNYQSWFELPQLPMELHDEEEFIKTGTSEGLLQYTITAPTICEEDLGTQIGDCWLPDVYQIPIKVKGLKENSPFELDSMIEVDLIRNKYTQTAITFIFSVIIGVILLIIGRFFIKRVRGQGRTGSFKKNLSKL